MNNLGYKLTPPFNHIVISFSAKGFSDGKNQNHNRFVSLALVLMGRVPAYDSPRSKSISGSPVPLTAKARIEINTHSGHGPFLDDVWHEPKIDLQAVEFVKYFEIDLGLTAGCLGRTFFGCALFAYFAWAS